MLAPVTSANAVWLGILHNLSVRNNTSCSGLSLLDDKVKPRLVHCLKDLHRKRIFLANESPCFEQHLDVSVEVCYAISFKDWFSNRDCSRLETSSRSMGTTSTHTWTDRQTDRNKLKGSGKRPARWLNLRTLMREWTCDSEVK